MFFKTSKWNAWFKLLTAGDCLEYCLLRRDALKFSAKGVKPQNIKLFAVNVWIKSTNNHLGHLF
jgi:hypothetical protein